MSGLTARNGSSPHTRGTLIVCPRWCAAQRFIPAYAGNARVSAASASPATVHPRIRGERTAIGSCTTRRRGSSPHTRGTQAGEAATREGGRFIPAYAGNAVSARRQNLSTSVHPRIRGERGPLCRMIGPTGGSSPHTRGTRRCATWHVVCVRFIPAYAGNAPGSQGRSCQGTVHPRIRGERTVRRGDGQAGAGSSPHTRGTRTMAQTEAPTLRFIPAYAGNARPPNSIRCSRSVHPRIRGERTSNKLLIYRRKSEPSDSTKHSAC